MSEPAKPTVAELLALLAKEGPALRAAGVQSFSIDGFVVNLAPAEAKIPERAPEPDYSDPLDDPMTFGRRDRVPDRGSDA